MHRLQKSVINFQRCLYQAGTLLTEVPPPLFPSCSPSMHTSSVWIEWVQSSMSVFVSWSSMWVVSTSISWSRFLVCNWKLVHALGYPDWGVTKSLGLNLLLSSESVDLVSSWDDSVDNLSGSKNFVSKSSNISSSSIIMDVVVNGWYNSTSEHMEGLLIKSKRFSW